ncbi:MAG: UDP-N-acetylmuramoyl-L-alanyl-D-glutamate--2,6-diaminopimelate ligase [Candidatus Sumerlaeaceae bacterium]
MTAQRWKLSELFEQAGLQLPPRSLNPAVKSITDDTRRIEPDCLFVATTGSKVDSHLFISDAVDKGAAAVLVERETPPYRGVDIVHVPDTRDALGRLAHAWHGNPSREMLVLGVTGTNGKTTTTFLLEAILRAAGYEPGVLGTIEYRFAGQRREAVNTTPTALQLAQLFAEMRDAGVTAVAMEVSSHAADQRRISGIEFDACLLTNITQDHLDYHGTMEAYAEAKKAIFFDYLLRRAGGTKKKGPAAAFNLDDTYAGRFAAEFPLTKITFAVDNPVADLRATHIQMSQNESAFRVESAAGAADVQMHLVGMFNVQNALGAMALAQAVDIPQKAILKGLATLAAVPGRLEQVKAGQPFMVLVDYAHTPDALERVLVNARVMTQRKLIAVFGCGGDRDAGKRPIMGRAAAELADYVIVTNDNPRTEDPEKIADQVMEGVVTIGLPLEHVARILDRKSAIEHALALADEGDVVVIAGKGHEDYQILGHEKIHFDDREVAREFLRARATAPL